MTNGNGDKITMPKWLAVLIVPMVMLIGMYAITQYQVTESKAEIKALKVKMESVERTAQTSGDDHQLLLEIRSQQTTIRESIARIEAKLDIH